MFSAVGADGPKKKGRGAVKGFKATKKRHANGFAKLNIAFSHNLGGAVGMNYRSFKDDVVIIMKRRLPIIGVRKWSYIHPDIHRLIVADMLDRYDLEDTPETAEKILKIAKERYRGWRASLSCTYKAYKTDDARMSNIPEDLQPEEWEWMIEYFGTDQKFQELSQKNSDNRKKLKKKHRAGSKSYSQLNFENRNSETGEEPDCIALWELTHTKNGTWTTEESKKVYPRGFGYMAKLPTSSQRIKFQVEEQARATVETQKINSELSQQVTELQQKLQDERATMDERINLERAEWENLQERLQEERAERERMMELERTSRHEFERNLMAQFNSLIQSKFQEFSHQMERQKLQTLQMFKKSNEKENISPNLQTPLAQSPAKKIIPPHTTLQTSRMYKAIDGNVNANGNGKNSCTGFYITYIRIPTIYLSFI
ncbi:unnamed protein product [Alopecurus aequalis]